MPMLLVDFLTALLRHLLTGAAGYFVAKGILTQQQSDTMTVALIGWVLVTGWALWNKYKNRVKLLTALEAPKNATEDDVKKTIAAGKGASVMTSNKSSSLLGVLLIVILGCGMACNGGPRHVAVVSDTALYNALASIHQLEQHALCGQESCAGVAETPIPGWSHDKSVLFNKRLLPAVEGGRQLNAQLAGWKPGNPLPQKVRDTVNSVSLALASVMSDFPESSTKTAILLNIARSQEIILAILDTYLAVKS